MLNNMKAWSFSWDSKNQGPRFAVKTLISDILKLISTISRSERNDTPTKSQPTKRSLDRSHCVLVNVLQESFLGGPLLKETCMLGNISSVLIQTLCCSRTGEGKTLLYHSR